MIRTFICQVCGKKSRPAFKIEDLPGWDISTFEFPERTIRVTSCHECSSLSPDKLFDGYRNRIAAGFDTSFH